MQDAVNVEWNCEIYKNNEDKNDIHKIMIAIKHQQNNYRNPINAKNSMTATKRLSGPRAAKSDYNSLREKKYNNDIWTVRLQWQDNGIERYVWKV